MVHLVPPPTLPLITPPFHVILSLLSVCKSYLFNLAL